MDKITDNIYLGSSQDGLHRKDKLKAVGITAILNVARDLTNTTTTHKEFEMYHVGIMDGGGNNQNMANAAFLVLSALLSDGHKVLVHCHEGKSRSAGLVAAYLVRQGKFNDVEEAIEFLRTKRPRVNPNTEIVDLFINVSNL
jgi:protein-tyrosine phosphatase